MGINLDRSKMLFGDCKKVDSIEEKPKISTLYMLEEGYQIYKTKEEAEQAALELFLIRKGRKELDVFLDYIDKNGTANMILGAYIKDDDFMRAYNNLKAIVEA